MYPLGTQSCPEFGANDLLQHEPSSSSGVHQSLINLYLNSQKQSVQRSKYLRKSLNMKKGNLDSSLIPMENGNVPINQQTSEITLSLGVNTLNHSVQHNNVQEQRLARISTSIVWLFILCHIWRMIPTVYEYLNSNNGLEVAVWPTALDVIENISHSLILTNSAVNFLIYVFM